MFKIMLALLKNILGITPIPSEAMIDPSYYEDIIIEENELDDDSLEGVNVHYYASATDGILLDLCKAGVRSFGMQLPADQNFGDMAYHLSDEVGLNGMIYTKVHSQGGMVLDNFRQYSTLEGEAASSRVTMKMDVNSFGSARILDDEKYYKASNYISTRDIVPFIGSPKNYCKALVRQRNDVLLKVKRSTFC